jgi:exosortase family protein XrtG
MGANVRTALTILGIFAVLATYVVGVWYFRRRRAWLVYYVFAAFGLTLILVFGARWIGLAGTIESLVTYSTAWLASHVGIASKWLGQSQFMVMGRSGWVVLETNIECSALIESSILAGLIFFYPVFDRVKKIKYFSIGIVVTVIANALRMLIIAGMTATLGRSAVFWGHAIVGRLFFFTVIIALYWFILTRPTIEEIAKTIGESRGPKDQRRLGAQLAGSVALVLLVVMGVFIWGDIQASRHGTSHPQPGRSYSVTRTKVADGGIQGIRADELTSAINVKDNQLVGSGDFKARLASNQTYLEFRYEGQLFSITTVPASFKKVAGKTQREIINFPGVMTATDLSQKLYVRRLKEEIRLVSSKAPTTFRFTVSPSDNLILKKSGDYLAFFRQSDNKELVKIEQPSAVDARGVKYLYRYDLKGNILTLKPVSSLANVVYPLVIDPSYTVVAGAATDSTYPSNNRKLARTSNGDLHAVYYRTATMQNIFYAKSTNGGITWTETALTTDTTYNQYAPVIAVDSHDYIHVVWCGFTSTRPGYEQIRYREYTTSWQAITEVTNEDDYHIYPAIAIDSADNIHAAWDAYAGTGYQQIEYEILFGAHTTLTSGSNHQYCPSIAVDGNGYVYIVWSGATDASPANTQIRSLRYTTSWQTLEEVTTNASYAQLDPSIAIDSSNNVHAVWSGNNGTQGNNQIRYCKRNTSTGWGSIGDVTPSASEDYGEFSATITIDSRDYLHVIWTGYHASSLTYKQIRYREYTTSWQPIQNLTSSGTNHQDYPLAIWARWPNISGKLTNRPKTGYAFIWMDGTTVKYYSSSDLLWDANTPGAALLAYGSITAGSVAQDYRTYAFGADWGAETNTPDTTHTTYWTALKASPTTTGAFVTAYVTTEAASNFKVYSYYNGTWTSEFAYTQTAAQYAYRCFDVAYENSSGKVLVVYGKSGGANTQVYYREGTWNAGTLHYDWTVETSFTFNTSYLSGSLRWLVLANELNSDEMILTAVSGSGTGNNISAAIWGGASFSKQNAVGWGLCGWISATAPTNWDFDCAYETSSGEGMVAWGFYNTANPYWKYVTYTGGAWNAVVNGPDPSSVLNGPIRVLSLAADPSPASNRIAAGIIEYVSAGTDDCDGVVWSGAAWTGPTSLDTAVYSTVRGRQVDVCYAGTTGNAILVYDDSTTADLDWSRSVGGAAFGAPTNWATTGGHDDNIQLVADASSDKIMYVELDSNSDLYAFYYTDGTTTWATTNAAAALEVDSSGGVSRESYMFAFTSVFRVPTLGVVLTIILVVGAIAIPVKRKVIFVKRTKILSKVDD